MPDRLTINEITSDQLDVLYDERDRLARYIANLRQTTVDDVLAEGRRQAAEERYRVTPEDIYRAFGVPMPRQPREHCGHIPPAATHAARLTECVLRPGHSGSHADEHGMRWRLHTFPAGDDSHQPATDDDGRARELEAELGDVRSSIDRVRALHHEDWGCCFECTHETSVRWPCPTIRALDATPAGADL